MALSQPVLMHGALYWDTPADVQCKVIKHCAVELVEWVPEIDGLRVALTIQDGRITEWLHQSKYHAPTPELFAHGSE